MVSKRLAESLNMDVISTDELIEHQEGRSIRQIFQESGEHYFRDREREAVREAAGRKNVVLDCGGGVVLNPQNVDDLRRNGILIYLSASPETIFERTKHQKDRPLLNVSQPQIRIAELLGQRKPLYEQADYTIETDGKTVDGVCEEIVRLLNQ